MNKSKVLATLIGGRNVRQSAFALMLGLGCWTSAAVAAPNGATARAEKDLGELEEGLVEVSVRTAVLERRIAPRGILSEEQGRVRFEDAVYDYMIGDYRRAAEVFFSLVATAVLEETELHRDAEWYLAESLRELGNVASAEAAYQVIMDDEAHPFRADAVRQMLRLYAQERNNESFDELFEREIASGRVSATPAIKYSVARSLLVKKEYGRARSYFLDIPPESKYYARARYHLGSINVLMGTDDALKEAIDYFRQTAELGVEGDSDADRKVRDYALLALGRVYYELGDFQQASSYYDRISGDSDLLDEKLYELVWAFIQQQDYKPALQAAEIFLLAYPQHEYTAQMRNIQGQLYYVEGEYDAALFTFDGIVSDYTEVGVQFSNLREGDQDLGDYVAELRTLRERSPYALSDDQTLPPYAVSMMLADDDLSRAVDLYTEITEQEEDLREAETLINELSIILEKEGGASSYSGTRFAVMRTRAQGLVELARVFELRAGWMADVVDSEYQSRVQAIGKRVEQLGTDANEAMSLIEQASETFAQLDEERLASEDTKVELGEQLAMLERELAEAQDLDTLEPLEKIQSQVTELESRLQRLEDIDKRVRSLLDQLDSDVGSRFTTIESSSRELSESFAALENVSGVGADRGSLGERFAIVIENAEETSTGLGALQALAQDMENTEMHLLRQRFQREKENVEGQRAELTSNYALANDASESLVRNGFGKLEGFFRQSVLNADMGAVRIYWARFVDNGSEREKILAERKRLTQELRRRFDYIRQKIDQ